MKWAQGARDRVKTRGHGRLVPALQLSDGETGPFSKLCQLAQLQSWDGGASHLHWLKVRGQTTILGAPAMCLALC